MHKLQSVVKCHKFHIIILSKPLPSFHSHCHHPEHSICCFAFFSHYFHNMLQVDHFPRQHTLLSTILLMLLGYLQEQNPTIPFNAYFKATFVSLPVAHSCSLFWKPSLQKRIYSGLPQIPIIWCRKKCIAHSKQELKLF